MRPRHVLVVWKVRVVDGEVGVGVVRLVVLGLVHPPTGLQPPLLGQSQHVVQQAAPVHLCKLWIKSNTLPIG